MCLHEHPVETRADLQRYYGLNLDRMGTDFDAFHAGACLQCLPLGSALMARLEPSCAWTVNDVLLHAIMSMLAGERLPYPWEEGRSNGGLPDIGALPLNEIKEWYEQQWEEVEGIDQRIGWESIPDTNP